MQEMRSGFVNLKSNAKPEAPSQTEVWQMTIEQEEQGIPVILHIPTEWLENTKETYAKMEVDANPPRRKKYNAILREFFQLSLLILWACCFSLLVHSLNSAPKWIVFIAILYSSGYPSWILYRFPKKT